MPDTGAASVLIIEDNQDVAESLSLFLRVVGGHTVRVAHDGLTGVRMAAGDPPDVAVCDIGLPGLDGYAVARAIVASVAVKPLLIAVTAYSGEHPEGKARAAGFDHYLVKPADPFAIESLIRGRARPPAPSEAE